MKRRLAGFALAVLVLAALEIFELRWLAPLENRLLDAFVRSHAARLAPDPDIVIVDIDDPSLARMGEKQEIGRWPWPRAVHAELLEGIAAQSPRAVVFDVLFDEKDTFRRESDEFFSEVASRSPIAYFPLTRLPGRNDPKFPPISVYARQLGLHASPGADPQARIALLPPLALPEAAWRRTGTIGFLEDPDGVGRRYAIREIAAGWEIPSLPARLARDLGWPLPEGDALVLAWRGARNGFRHVPYADLYEDFNRAQRMRPADELRGKIVLVGTAATGMQDLRVTPLGSLYPGVEILATAIENLKNGRSMRYAPSWAQAAAAVVLLLGAFVAFRGNVAATRVGLLLGAATAALLAASWLLVQRLVLAPVLAPLAAAWLFYLAAAGAAYLRERHARREAIAMFSRFVNPHVVAQLVERGGIEGGGQTREVTLLFSDIRGFTSLSERRAPEEVVALLNRYFTLQVDVIFRHGGSLDKFIGDAIMALWGAPLEDREHARHAVACALDMAEALQRFRDELGEPGRDFDVGIGIHSGPAVVGLIGSERRREYTSIGDTVNLASRIEGLTKDAKRRILVSRETMARCAGAFDFEPCGSYKVKGRAQEVELFEPRRKS
jgi:adenylate cyclase